jgi:PHP family Zn ribbon phosphoesterase
MLSIPEIAEKVKQLNGLYIAAHIDRPNYSVISGLGAIPEGCFDAVDLSRTADEAIWKAHAADLALTRSSDAHNLDDVARVWTECDIDDFTVTELKKAFERKATVISPKLTRF